MNEDTYFLLKVEAIDKLFLEYTRDDDDPNRPYSPIESAKLTRIDDDLSALAGARLQLRFPIDENFKHISVTADLATSEELLRRDIARGKYDDAAALELLHFNKSDVVFAFRKFESRVLQYRKSQCETSAGRLSEWITKFVLLDLDVPALVASHKIARLRNWKTAYATLRERLDSIEVPQPHTLRERLDSIEVPQHTIEQIIETHHLRAQADKQYLMRGKLLNWKPLADVWTRIDHTKDFTFKNTHYPPNMKASLFRTIGGAIGYKAPDLDFERFRDALTSKSRRKKTSEKRRENVAKKSGKRRKGKR
jgi:phage pi2 protein 07